MSLDYYHYSFIIIIILLLLLLLLVIIIVIININLIALKCTISLGSQKRKDRKTRKSRREEKVMSFNSASLFPEKKREPVTQGGTRVLDNRCGGKPRETVSSKVGRISETTGTFQIHSRKTIYYYYYLLMSNTRLAVHAVPYRRE